VPESDLPLSIYQCYTLFTLHLAEPEPISMLDPHLTRAQMDRMGANFFRTVDMIVSNLAAKPLVLTLPIGAEDNFEARHGPCF